MPGADVALARLRRLGPVFRARDAVAAGVSWRDLYGLRDVGDIVELSRGLYQLAEAAGGGYVDFVAVSVRAPRGMVCLNSAIAYWGFSDEIPPVVHLAVPEGSHRPVIDYPPVRVHVFRARTFQLGRCRVEEELGESFWITDRERTVVDAYRLRHRIGEDLAHAALREYLRSSRSPARLAELAQALRVWAPLSDAIKVLQG
jgi:predicted transcriptional regulator of viral defense system